MKKWNPEPGRISFNPRTPCGVRPSWAFFCCHCGMFQSTHSLRSATEGSDLSNYSTDVSIHALLAECDSSTGDVASSPMVSIHALLAECDQRRCAPPETCMGFNPRTPCGVRLLSPRVRDTPGVFQSTHSLRSATTAIPTHVLLPTVSIHALLAECDTQNLYSSLHLSVSIHALLAECDAVLLIPYQGHPRFNPRTPCGVRLGIW